MSDTGIYLKHYPQKSMLTLTSEIHPGIYSFFSSYFYHWLIDWLCACAHFFFLKEAILMSWPATGYKKEVTLSSLNSFQGLSSFWIVLLEVAARFQLCSVCVGWHGRARLLSLKPEQPLWQVRGQVPDILASPAAYSRWVELSGLETWPRWPKGATLNTCPQQT